MTVLIRRTILVALILLVIPLAFMNRQDVALYLDISRIGDADTAIQLPLFLVILTCLFIGIIMGYFYARVIRPKPKTNNQSLIHKDTG
jgi:predicted permease